MTLRFGTDGVRGDADSLLISESVVALARATARVLGTQSTFLIGTDTRRSGPRIAEDFAAGIASVGGACEFLGVLPTPGIAFASERGSQPAVVP